MTKTGAKHITGEEGQILVLVLITLAVVLISTLLIVGGATLYSQSSNYILVSEKALNIAEAGADQAIAFINKTGGSYSGTGGATMPFGGGEYTVAVTTKADSTKVVVSTGYIPNISRPLAKKEVRVEASRGIGVAFVYGVQIGGGGFEMGNSNIIKGSIYSNGDVEAGNGNLIEGDAWVAGGAQPLADLQPDCIGTNCGDFEFGKNVGGDNRLDIAQSFKPTVTENLNKVLIKIKKQGNPGNPPNIPVRILGNSSGRPDKNAVLASGTLYSSLAVKGDYSWVEVTFDSMPSLTADTVYWIVLDTSADSSNYWSWQNDIVQSYPGGLPKWSPNWNTGNPTWNAFTGDLSFKTYMGGFITKLEGENPQNPLVVNGNAHAHVISGTTVKKDAYFKTITNSTVLGVSHPGYEDPPPKVFPISEANITEWKNNAVQAEPDPNNPVAENITNCISTLNAGVYGNVSLTSNCNTTVNTPIWITGNLVLDSHNTLTLASNYGTASGVIIVDGTITLNSNNSLKGTSQGNSLLMALSAYDSRSNGISAIKLNSNGNTGVFYANNGIIEPGTGNTFKELTGWKIKVLNSSIIDYETGLASTLFSSGPSGSYSLVKGSYQIK